MTGTRSARVRPICREHSNNAQNICTCMSVLGRILPAPFPIFRPYLPFYGRGGQETLSLLARRCQIFSGIRRPLPFVMAVV